MKVILQGSNNETVEIFGVFKNTPSRWLRIEIKDEHGNFVGYAEVQKSELESAVQLL